MAKQRKVPSNMTQRLRQHEHNRMCGNLRMAQALLHGIANSPTCTVRARELARNCAYQLQLMGALITDWRVNADGTVVKPKRQPKP